jgi:hypothetical protein
MTKFGISLAALASCIAASLVGAAAQVAPVVPPTPVAPMSPTTQSPDGPSMASNPNNVADPMVTKDPNQIICVKEKLTGSMLPSTVCQTRRAWIRMGGDSRDIIDHAQRVGSGQPGGG